MPKQGQFAKSTRFKKIKNLKVKRHDQRGGTLPDAQLTDFLVVRFALTAKKRVRPEARETTQRFLIELSDHLPAYGGDLSSLVPDRLERLNAQVPWQFFAQLTANWELLQKFLVKELPAVPLAKRLRITKQVAAGEFNQLVAAELAKKGAAATLLKRPASAAARRQLTAVLLPTLCQNGKVNWDKVRALLAPLPFHPEPSLDQPTREWLMRLSQQ